MQIRRDGVRTGRPRWAEWLWVGVSLACVGVASLIADPVPTTLEDFFVPGSQPGSLQQNMVVSTNCTSCHAFFDPVWEPWEPWAASMMGQSARDPIFHACLTIAEQDASFAGDLCIRCHAPTGWIEGRSVPTNGSALIGKDFDGVSCQICHRMVDPVYRPGISPVEDLAILQGLPHPPITMHNGSYVVDPRDRRRGPYDVSATEPHPWLQSAYHRDSAMCQTCHDVSNPVFERQPNGTYTLTELGEPHPTNDKYDQFPIERTYSEWSQSAFAQGPINMGGRFGGNKLEVSSCQDCHMPRTEGVGCFFGEWREDLGSHFFNGGNTWVLKAVRTLYPDLETGLTTNSVNDSVARAHDMLAKASDMELSVEGSQLKVRVTNQTGHKLPTGYPEGRRMWINVQFLDGQNQIVREHGAYDEQTAVLTANDTKVYEAKLGLDETMANITGKPEGPGFHFVLSNKVFKDNRIPPRGFTVAGFESVQAGHVGYSYEDGQYWDDTEYEIPVGAVRADVRVYFQTTSKEYIEFLRDANVTNNTGQIAYDQWVLHGKSTPALMDEDSIELAEPCYADCDPITGPGVLDIFDFLCFGNKFAANDPYACDCDTSTGPGVCDIFDFLCFGNAFNKGCP